MPHLGAANVAVVIVAATLDTSDGLGAVTLFMWKVWAFSCGWESTEVRSGEEGDVAFGGVIWVEMEWWTSLGGIFLHHLCDVTTWIQLSEDWNRKGDSRKVVAASWIGGGVVQKWEPLNAQYGLLRRGDGD